ncbi:protein-disulfide reductase DsbD [Herminiimonas aquatilis]|uniref:Thiol:disulfide interchange protein DsbD n=1 Tax=Herminiimonas aquatilis TaxID=345342 RepID=A0ABW2J5J3_9BURK
MRAIALCVVLVGLPFTAHAEEDFLAPEVAFKFSAQMADAQTIAVTYAIADGYYMYRERFAFKASNASLGEPQIPSGKIKFDETFQKNVETYRNSVTIRIPVQADGRFTLTATSQGCSDKGLCYSPMDSQASLAAQGGVTGNVPQSMEVSPLSEGPGTRVVLDSDMGRIERSLQSGKLLAILPLFLLLGLGLAFTPCVLPMVPILSSIIVGEGAQVKRSRGLLLAGLYSLGMALVYTCLGIAAGLIGEGLSAALQNPWMLSAFALLMVGLALSMFDVYHLQMHTSVQRKLTHASSKQTAGKLVGVFAMGALSALIVGPCVAAPLAGALVYISQTRDVIIGGGALFAMAIGMSVPLLLVGVSAGALLPRAGSWMNAVKRFFGVLMLGLAIWMISPIIPDAVQMIGWAALGIAYGAYLLWAAKGRWISKAVGLVFAALGLVQLVGVTTGGRDALAPLAHMRKDSAEHADFTRVKTVADLDAAIAKAHGKNVMLDFYADWCVSCIEMEKLTFTDPRVQRQFADMVLLQVDVTANDMHDKELLRRYNLFGPPGIIFFDKNGQEIRGGRVIGFQKADKFTQSLALIKQF